MKDLIERLRTEKIRGIYGHIDRQREAAADALEAQEKRIKELESKLVTFHDGMCKERDELTAALATKNIVLNEIARSSSSSRLSRIAKEALAIQPHASLVNHIKADAVREAAKHVGSGMYCAELVEYARAIEREAYRAGQESMLDRAATVADNHDDALVGTFIRNLEIEEPK